MNPIFALHKDAKGNVLAAGNFEYEHDKAPWFRALDLRPGDKIEIGEIAKRPEFDEVEPAPAFLDPAPAPVPAAAAADDQPF